MRDSGKSRKQDRKVNGLKCKEELNIGETERIAE